MSTIAARSVIIADELPDTGAAIPCVMNRYGKLRSRFARHPVYRPCGNSARLRAKATCTGCGGQGTYFLCERCYWSLVKGTTGCQRCNQQMVFRERL